MLKTTSENAFCSGAYNKLNREGSKALYIVLRELIKLAEEDIWMGEGPMKS